MMQLLYIELETAMECELVAKVLDVLVDIAEARIGLGETTEAAEILAVTMEYPMRGVTLERANRMFTDLEMELCPRAITDARALAQELTLEELVTRVMLSAKSQ